MVLSFLDWWIACWEMIVKGHDRSLGWLLGFGVIRVFFSFVFSLVRLDKWIFMLVEWGEYFGVCCYCGAALIVGERINFRTFLKRKYFPTNWFYYNFVCWDCGSFVWN